MEKSRSKVIVKSGYIFILTNFLLAIFNLAVGFLAGSLAIISDAAHSLIDAVSGFVVLIGEKIAKQKKDEREKIERATTVIIAVIIIVTGVHIVMEAIEKIAEGDSVPDYSIATVIVLIGSIIVKFALAKYLYRRGEKYKSKVLTASGAETMNDMLISVAVFASVLFYFAWGIDIEAYVSIAISLIIFKIGLEFLFPKLSKHHHHPLETDPTHGAA